MAARTCALLAASLATAASAVTVRRAEATGDRKITEVVKLLQELLDKSQAEGDLERNLFAKYKCYCDTNERTKTEEISKLSEDISTLQAKIEELQADTGKLSKEVAQLDKDKTQNERDREQAVALRGKEHEAFLAQEADLVGAVSQMDGAVETLAQVSADQSISSAQDHAQYMAGFDGGSLLKLKSTVNSALLAASSFVTPKQIAPVQSFLQAPFTGSYSAKSGEVVGILKSMRDTFKANLAAAREAEARAAKAHADYMDQMLEAHREMVQSLDRKQTQLGANDGDLASKRDQLGAAESQKAEAEDFLAKLMEMCTAKSKQYQERVDLRSQEQAALSQATAILNSDEAFATFGKVSATSGQAALGFIQVHQHRQSAVSDAQGPRRQRAQVFLQNTEEDKGFSPLLTRILSMLQANNPFKVVLSEISKMLGLIEQEEKADIEQKRFCDKERADTNDSIDLATTSIRGLNAAIAALRTAIHDPETGLLAQISSTEESLTENYGSQESETSERKEENAAYQKDIASLEEAQDLVSQAVSVLTKYYAKVAKAMGAPAFAQEDPTPPATFDDHYKGQSANGGHGAIDMLKFILKNADEEERVAHLDEMAAQHAYEDSMTQLKASESALQNTLASLKMTLAEKEQQLMMKEEDLERTVAEKTSLEAYLEKIKPGCDFITTHIEKRMASRVEETASLKQARNLLEGSPVYKQAEERAHQESLGECRNVCQKSEAHVDCKACLAKTSVPGFCAGHPDTEGC